MKHLVNDICSALPFSFSLLSLPLLFCKLLKYPEREGERKRDFKIIHSFNSFIILSITWKSFQWSCNNFNYMSFQTIRNYTYQVIHFIPITFPISLTITGTHIHLFEVKHNDGMCVLLKIKLTKLLSSFPILSQFSVPISIITKYHCLQDG